MPNQSVASLFSNPSPEAKLQMNCNETYHNEFLLRYFCNTRFNWLFHLHISLLLILFFGYYLSPILQGIDDIRSVSALVAMLCMLVDFFSLQ
jgi:hypothetical protein